MRYTMIKTVEYKRNFYPKFQTEGNASQFAIPLHCMYVKDMVMILDV